MRQIGGDRDQNDTKGFGAIAFPLGCRHETTRVLQCTYIVQQDHSRGKRLRNPIIRSCVQKSHENSFHERLKHVLHLWIS